MTLMLRCLARISGPGEFNLLRFLSVRGLRLRAAIFVNLVAMRASMSRKRNPGRLLMSPENLRILQSACFLYHCAHNSFLTHLCGHVDFS